MKKKLLLFCIVFLVSLLLACTSNEENENEVAVIIENNETEMNAEANEVEATEEEIAEEAAAKETAAKNRATKEAAEAEQAAIDALVKEEEAKEAAILLATANALGKKTAALNGYIEPDDSDNPKLPAKITYLGRATMRIEFADDTVVYIDPYSGNASDYEIAADLVLVTHQHNDHNKVEKVTLKEGGQIIMCPDDAVSGDSFELYGLTITVVSAYNKNHRKEECCGYIIQAGEMTIYHAGDTSYIPEMTELTSKHIDYAFLPMDGYYNMGPEEALEVANTILAEVIIPIHTDPNSKWGQVNADEFAAENKFILKPGKTMIIE